MQWHADDYNAIGQTTDCHDAVILSFFLSCSWVFSSTMILIYIFRFAKILRWWNVFDDIFINDNDYSCSHCNVIVNHDWNSHWQLASHSQWMIKHSIFKQLAMTGRDYLNRNWWLTFVVFVYCRNDVLYQIVRFVDEDGDAIRDGANLGDFVAKGYKEFVKVDTTCSIKCCDEITVIQVFTKHYRTPFTQNILFDFIVNFFYKSNPVCPMA